METEGTEEQAAGILESALGIDVDIEEEGEGEEDGEETLRALRAIEFLTQDTDPSGTMIFDARNRFSDLSHLEMLWTVRHCWLAGASFTFN